MSKFELGYLIGVGVTHLAVGLIAGRWLEWRKWKRIRERAGV